MELNSLKVGLKVNMKKMEVIFNNQLAGQQIIIGNGTLESRVIYLNLDQQLVQTYLTQEYK